MQDWQPGEWSLARKWWSHCISGLLMYLKTSTLEIKGRTQRSTVNLRNNFRPTFRLICGLCPFTWWQGIVYLSLLFIPPTSLHSKYSESRLLFLVSPAMHLMLQETKGPTLTSFLVALELQCSPERKEQTFPYFEETSVIVPPLQNATHSPCAQLH